MKYNPNLKYRKLNYENDVVRAGDIHSLSGNGDDLSTGATAASFIGQRNAEWEAGHSSWYRPNQQDNWIAFSERKPTKEDANEFGKIVARYKSGDYHFVQWSGLNHFEYWMPLNFTPREPTRIKVDGHEVIPNKDGSIKVGCQTVASQDFEEIVRQRQEAMK